MARTVELRPGATEDLSRIARYISNRVSPTSAARWLTAIRATIARLATDAEQCAEAVEAAALGIDLRYVLHGRQGQVYRVLFTFDDTTVHVLRVRHAAQDSVDAYGIA